MLPLPLSRLLPALFALLATGCASWSGVRFVPSPFEVAVAPDAEAPAVGRAIFAWQGIAAAEDGGYEARFRVRVHDDGAGVLRLDPAGCQLVDASLEPFAPPRIARVDGAEGLGAFVVPEDGAGVWNLAFPFAVPPEEAHLDALHLTLALLDERGGIHVSATFDRLRRQSYGWGGSVFYGSGWHLSGGSDAGLSVSAQTALGR